MAPSCQTVTPPPPLSTQTSSPEPLPSTTDSGTTKDAELWFDDGNIVLIAPDAPSKCDKVAFRVYKGILARASPVFSDLFELAVAHPEAATPTLPAHIADEDDHLFDGCPAVTVTESAIEMRHFLRALFQSGVMTLRVEYAITRQPFARLAAIARLAHKYQADALAAAAFERIEMFFTAQQNPWVKDLAYTWKDGLESRKEECALELKHNDAMEAVNLARLFEKPLMLPLALYMCCVLDSYLLRNGVPREDGTLEKLSDDDFGRCMRAMLIMTKEGYAHLRETLEGRPAPTCAQEEQCTRRAESAASEVWGYPFSLRHVFLRADKRGSLGRPNFTWGVQPTCLDWACTACKNQRMNKSTKMALAAWRLLPSWLSLEDKPSR
ncbi:hypothetical protein BC628DRAFT_1345951 [Trametes gibbosa]|nr:hypothetical protein BC628DRAFT_1345951 [Trametes gibbosa]